jgi:hypothetical protein
LAPIFVVSTKCIVPLILELVVLNTGTNNEWTNSILLNFHGTREKNHLHGISLEKIIYCESIVIRRVLIFVDFVDNRNHENLTK